MRVLHVLDHSPPTQSGYAIRSAAILREQRRRGWDTLAVTGPKHGRGAPGRETFAGLTYLRVPDPADWTMRTPVLNQLRVIQLLRAELRRTIAEYRPDVVQAHSPCLNALAAFGLGVPVVYEMRSSWEDAAVSTGTTTEGSLRYRASRWLETRALLGADAVTTICEGLREEAVRRGVRADRIGVVPNAVDADELTPVPRDATQVRARFGLGDAPVIGFVGSYFAWEGLSLLIDALPRVLERLPRARVLLVGGGVEEPALRAAVRRGSLEGAVTFAGLVPHAQVADMYAAIDVLAYPRLPMRLTEMVTPLKPLEAMALGKVFVASDVGGHRELVRDGETGLLFRAGDAASLADALVRALTDRSLRQRLREEGPRHVREQRTWERSVANYEPVYRALAPGAFSR